MPSSARHAPPPLRPTRRLRLHPHGRLPRDDLHPPPSAPLRGDRRREAPAKLGRGGRLATLAAPPEARHPRRARHVRGDAKPRPRIIRITSPPDAHDRHRSRGRSIRPLTDRQWDGPSRRLQWRRPSPSGRCSAPSRARMVRVVRPMPAPSTNRPGQPGPRPGRWGRRSILQIHRPLARQTHPADARGSSGNGAVGAA